MDVSKLAPAPWRVTGDAAGLPFIVYPCPADEGCADGCLRIEKHLEFIALARNAFDVMMRRGWTPRKTGEFWTAGDLWHSHDAVWYVGPWGDPFTALVEADKWYKERVES
jgi:hypothetical protein